MNINCHTQATGNQVDSSLQNLMTKYFARFGFRGARSALLRHVKDKHEIDVAQGVAEDATQDVAQTWPSGAWAARALLATPPPPPPPSLPSLR